MLQKSLFILKMALQRFSLTICPRVRPWQFRQYRHMDEIKSKYMVALICDPMLGPDSNWGYI